MPFSSEKSCHYYCISSSPFSEILIMCVLCPLKLSHGSCMLCALLMAWIRVISSFPSLFPPACQFGDFCWPTLGSLLLPQLYWADYGFRNGGLHLFALDAQRFFLIPCLAFLLTVPDCASTCFPTKAATTQLTLSIPSSNCHSRVWSLPCLLRTKLCSKFLNVIPNPNYPQISVHLGVGSSKS